MQKRNKRLMPEPRSRSRAASPPQNHSHPLVTDAHTHSILLQPAVIEMAPAGAQRRPEINTSIAKPHNAKIYLDATMLGASGTPKTPGHARTKHSFSTPDRAMQRTSA